MKSTTIEALLALCTGITIQKASAFSSAHRPSIKPRRKSTLYEQPVNLKQLLGTASPSTMQNYNLLPDIIADGLSAQIITRLNKAVDDKRETTEIVLVPKNTEDHFIDTFSVEIPIPLDSPGLGIELIEIEGGREDGLGIVIVNDLVPGGNAQRALDKKATTQETIMYGDSISAAELILRRSRSITEEKTDVLFARTECLGYESTIEKLGTLLSSLSNDNDDSNIEEATMILTLRRLRRRPQIQVKLHYPPSQELPPEIIKLQPGDNLRMAMLQRGVKLNDPLAQRYDGKPTGSGNCGSGGLCRTCAVSVMRGGELLTPPKQNEKKMLEDTPRWRLACKSWVGYEMKEGEISIQVNPRQW
jgi:ferredoxin